MRVEIGTTQPWKVFETTYYSTIGQAFEIGTAHIGHKGWIGAKGTHRQARIIGIGQHIDDGHEVDIQPQTRQVGSRAMTGIVGYRGVAGRPNRLFRNTLARDLAQFVDHAALTVGCDEERERCQFLYALVERDKLTARLGVAVLILD